MAVAKKTTQVVTQEANARGNMIRGSTRKLNLVAQLIRGMQVARALDVLAHSKRRMANDVRKVLQSAIANAENNFGLDIDRLEVKEASVGRALVMKRFHARGRSRAGHVWKEYSKLYLVVREEKDV